MPNSSKDPNAIWREQLKQRLQDAVQKSGPLLAARQFQEAETLIQAIDGDIYGALAIAKMYEDHLSMLVAHKPTAQDRSRVETVYQRALHWALRAYPTPHTACEANDYHAAQKEDHARLVSILGYEPRVE